MVTRKAKKLIIPKNTRDTKQIILFQRQTVRSFEIEYLIALLPHCAAGDENQEEVAEQAGCGHWAGGGGAVPRHLPARRGSTTREGGERRGGELLSPAVPQREGEGLTLLGSVLLAAALGPRPLRTEPSSNFNCNQI
jgi:hypothetical protein